MSDLSGWLPLLALPPLWWLAGRFTDRVIFDRYVMWLIRRQGRGDQ